jgi:hypothetical protein
MLSFLSFCPSSRAATPSVGDIFIGVGKGQYLWYTFNGTQYVLVQAITVGGSTDQTSGCAFDSQLNLYVTDTTSGQVFELNSSSLSLVQTLSPAPGVGATSVLFDASGKLYVGIGGVAGTARFGLLKYTPILPPNTATGTFSYSGPTNLNQGKNSDWIDLATDQKTLYLTNETSSILKEDLSVASPSPATFSTPSAGQGAFAVRILSPFDGSGGFLVADSNRVAKLDSTGAVLTTYAFGNSKNLTALTLDPNGTSAWVADFKTGNVYRFNIQTGAIEFKISTPGWTSPNGLCVKGGPELNVVPLSYNIGSSVTATAHFGAPGTNNFHTWTATVGQVINPFILVVTATEGIDLHRFDEYFCNQAIINEPGCLTLPSPASPTLTPIPYADQQAFNGSAIPGKAVVYRVANPPTPESSFYDVSLGVFIYTSFTYPTANYTPPTCGAGVAPVRDPRFFRAPGSGPDLPSGDTPNDQFTYDSTTFTDLDLLNGGIGKGWNDYNAADRCPSSVGSSMTFLSPLPKAQVSINSSVPLDISVLDAFGNPILGLTASPNDLSLSVTQFGVPLTVFGVPGNSPDFFNPQGTKYHANLKLSSVTGLQLGLATLCVSSINTNFTNGDIGTSRATAVAPPVCVDVNVVTASP